MPIEFRCTQCKKLLRAPDDAAGRQAKCPECGETVPVPLSDLGGSEGPAPAAPGSPFGFAGPDEARRPETARGEDAVNPYESPPAYAEPSGRAATGTELGRHLLDFGDAFNRTWEIFKVQWPMCFVVVLMVALLNLAVNFGFSITATIVAGVAQDPAVSVMVQLADNVGTWLFQTWIGIGEALFLLKIARGEVASVSVVFAGGRYFGKILGGSILLTMITALPLLVCTVPGLVIFLGGDVEVGVLAMGLGGLLAAVPVVVIGLMFSQYYYLILDRNLGIIESLSLSKDLMVGNKLMLFAIFLVNGLLVIAGLLVCCVGVLAVLPYVFLLVPVVYLTLTGQPTGARTWPAPPYAPDVQAPPPL